jgi:hypothetical protein
MELKYSLHTIGLAVLLTINYGVPGFSIAAGLDDSPSRALPRGVIVMWSGSLEEIPTGWALCDGSNGTPDLRDRFVMGVGARKYMGTIGGSHAHEHRNQDHSHRIALPGSHLSILRGFSRNGGYPGFRGGTLRSHRYYSGTRAFASQPASIRIDGARHLPPYYKLAFIMKN